MRFFFSCSVLVLFFGTRVSAQVMDTQKPRLVVGIVVDQMRNDYIYRYWNRFGEGGFKRLVKEGFYFRNTHFNYIPTYTGPGHASIYTGTTPRNHGIIANNWYNAGEGNMVYCSYDDAVQPEGTEAANCRMSPHRLLVNTVGDELKLATIKKSKVFAVALKDRGAVLPAGHSADAAYWFDESTGNFVSSSWYSKNLPAWLNDFNSGEPVKKYLSQPWNTLYPINSYTASLPDDNNYESLKLRADKPVFPYDFGDHVKKRNWSVIRATPYGNSITKDAALACLRYEGLGKDEITDMLCISFSSPDVIGHDYGPRAIEIEDVYLRLDRDIEEILKALDKEVGAGRYTLFLTGDHAAGDVPSHLLDEKMHAGYVYESTVRKLVHKFCHEKYQDSSLIANVSNEQIFLNTQKIASSQLDQELLEKQLCELLISTPGIAAAYPSEVLRYSGACGDIQLQLLQNGYHFKRSGHVALVLEPGFMDHSRRGTSHGTGYVYDTHVPLVFFGNGIPKGESFLYTPITSIAPTLSELLRIARPNGSTEAPLNGFFKKSN